jgi:penicillin-binding protein-related factor A (putative recombinase)
MTLPDLPKQHKKKEANFAIYFRHWLEKNPRHSASFEMKDTRGRKSLPFSEIKPEQIAYAQAIGENKKGVLIRVQGMAGEPDYVYLNQQPAYFVVRYPDFFCLISVGNLLFEKQKKAKSLSVERALAICTISVPLK